MCLSDFSQAETTLSVFLRPSLQGSQSFMLLKSDLLFPLFMCICPEPASLPSLERLSVALSFRNHILFILYWSLWHISNECPCVVSVEAQCSCFSTHTASFLSNSGVERISSLFPLNPLGGWSKCVEESVSGPSSLVFIHVFISWPYYFSQLFWWLVMLLGHQDLLKHLLAV